MEERFDRIDARLERLETGQTELRSEVGRLDGRLDTLNRHTRVLHEDLISRIAAISEEPLATRAEMNRGFGELKQLMSRRIDPLELVVRHLVEERNKGG